MDTLLTQLEQNLKELYRKAVDADTLLAQLRQQGQANFSQIMKNDGSFNCQADHFMPYLTETADQIYAIKQSGQFNTATLQRVVRQLQVLHKTLADLQAALKK